jgi:hypothetical protein
MLLAFESQENGGVEERFMSKNIIEARKEGSTIEIKIIASSEEMADKLFDMIELFGTAAFRIDIEKEWESDRP